MPQVKQKDNKWQLQQAKYFFSATLKSKLPSQHREQNRTVPYAGFSELVTAEAGVGRCSSK